MIKKIVSVYDTVGKFYSPLYLYTTVGEALRSFSDSVNDPKAGTLNAHPKDYIMYELGDYDDSTGLITPVIPPNRLGIGSDYKEVVK